MHELAVAMEICRIAEATLGDVPPAALRVVGVDVGDDAGVDASSLEFCLEALLRQPPFADAAPALRRVEGDDLRVSYLEVDDGGADDPAP